MGTPFLPLLILNNACMYVLTVIFRKGLKKITTICVISQCCRPSELKEFKKLLRMKPCLRPPLQTLEGSWSEGLKTWHCADQQSATFIFGFHRLRAALTHRYVNNSEFSRVGSSLICVDTGAFPGQQCFNNCLPVSTLQRQDSNTEIINTTDTTIAKPWTIPKNLN